MKFIVLFLFAALSVHAEIFTPESAAAFAADHNRELLAARFAIQEAEARLVQAGLWRNPAFEVGTDFDTQTRRGDRLVNISLSQRFPLAGRLEKSRNLARSDIAMAIAEFQNQRRLLFGNVLAQARTVLLLDRKLSLQKSQISLLDRILEQTTNAAQNGRGDTAEIGVVQLERATLALQRQSLAIPRQTALDLLTGWLGFSPDTPLQITGTLPMLPNFDVASSRPDLLLAEIAAHRVFFEEKLARAEKWEDLTVGVGYTRERDSAQYDSMAQLKLSIPLPIFDRNQGRLAETLAARKRTLGELSARRFAIANEIQEARHRAVGLSSILAQTQGPLLTLARQNTALIEQAATAGSASFLTIYESRRQHLNLSLAALETQTSLVTAITDWETRSNHFPGRLESLSK